MMMARFVSRRSFHATRAALQATDAGAEGGLRLTLALPHAPIIEDKAVDLVNLPSVAGTYGITAGHTPNVSQLMPGVVEIYETRDSEPEKYFVAGGYAVFSPDNKLQIAAVEACNVDDLDAAAVQAQLADSKTKMGQATPGSEEHASAQIEWEANTAMAQALGA